MTRSGTDRYTGFSIDLWNEIARRNAWNTGYRWYVELPAALADVRAGEVDVAIAGISITRQREQAVDFSYPMFNSGLEVLTPTSGGGSTWANERGGLASAVGRYLLALVVVLIVAGHVVWLATRRRTGRGYLPGVGLGVYKAAGLGLAGDFGVGEPERPIARLVAVVWTILGICFVSLFTAAVTTQLTVQTIQGKVRGVQDLSSVRAVTVGGTAAAYLKAHSIPFTGVGSIEEAYPMLADGKVDAVVFDAPVLEHHVQVTNTARQIVVGGIFAPEDYGIVFPTGSPLRKKVNATLLDMRDDGTYDEIYAKYFGAGPTTGPASRSRRRSPGPPAVSGPQHSGGPCRCEVSRSATHTRGESSGATVAAPAAGPAVGPTSGTVNSNGSGLPLSMTSTSSSGVGRPQASRSGATVPSTNTVPAWASGFCQSGTVIGAASGRNLVVDVERVPGPGGVEVPAPVGAVETVVAGVVQPAMAQPRAEVVTLHGVVEHHVEQDLQAPGVPGTARPEPVPLTGPHPGDEPVPYPGVTPVDLGTYPGHGVDDQRRRRSRLCLPFPDHRARPRPSMRRRLPDHARPVLLPATHDPADPAC